MLHQFWHWSLNCFKHFPTCCHLWLQKFPFAAFTERKQQHKTNNNKILTAQTKREEMWTVLWSVRSFPLNCECMQHSKGTSAKWYASHSSLSPSSLLLQLVCFCLYIQVFTLALGFFSPISSIQVLQLTKPPFIAAQRQLCTSLCHACFPWLAHVLAVCRPPCFDILPTSPQSSSRLQ